MKNVFLYSWLLCAVTICGYGQFVPNLQNNNWIVGEENLYRFFTPPATDALDTTLMLSNPGIVPSGMLGTVEGLASVSDRLGNLILFSDGIRLWYRPNQNTPDTYLEITTPTTLLMGNVSSAQNVIFVPVPNNQDRYYIFTIDGLTRHQPNGTNRRGLYWSMVDLNGGNPTLTTPVVLQDHLGVNIDINYGTANEGNFSEGITSCLHNNGLDYWMVAHVQPGRTGAGFLLSYQVTETGIGVGGMANDFHSLDLREIGSFLQPNNSYGFCIKISRASLISNPANILNIAMAANFGGVHFGTFDNSNGAFNMDLNPIGIVMVQNAPTYYAIEYSPDSQVLYYPESNYNRFNKTGFPFNIANVYTDPSTISNEGLQLAIDGNIYFNSSIGGTQRMRFITNSNDLTNPIDYNNIIDMQKSTKRCLPQWVYKQSCEQTLTDDEDIPAGFFDVNEQRSETIFLTNTISGPSTTPALNATKSIYHAGDFIEMLPDNGTNLGFEAEYGSEFVAYIADCGTGFDYRPSNPDASPNQASEKASVLSASSNLQIYPNPSNTFVTIALSDSKLKNIVITSLDGKVIQSRNVKSNSEQIDVSGFSNGMYFIAIQTDDGKTIIKKFIKN